MRSEKAIYSTQLKIKTNSIPLQPMNLHRSNLFSLLIPLVFGIPFLLLTDLFPFHRYGMFARLPSKIQPEEVRIRIKEGLDWKELQTGSPCLDRGLMKTAVSAAFEKDEKAAVLLSQLQKSCKSMPDSIILESSFSGKSKRKLLFP